MARKIDVQRLKTRSANAVGVSLARYEAVSQKHGGDHLLVRWIAKMTAVEIHALWERYVEQRLAAALNHSPAHFLKVEDINGVTRVSSGLANYVVRGGRRFFDFRSMGDLLGKADSWLGSAHNPFRKLSETDRKYLDALATIRNSVVHSSAASQASYRRTLRQVYNITAAPAPDEFLHARDFRAASPARYEPRIRGLATIVSKSIQGT